MTRGYARACGGQRVAEGAPQGHWKILTILSALSLRGLLGQFERLVNQTAGIA